MRTTCTRRSTSRRCRVTGHRSGRATPRPASTGPIANNFPGYQTAGILNQGVRGYHFWDFLLTLPRRGGAQRLPRRGWHRPVRRRARSSRGRPASTRPRCTRMSTARRSCSSTRTSVPCSLRTARVSATLVRSADRQLLGSATIRAEALDPYQLTFNDPRLSNTLTKNVFELAGKSLDCVPKSADRGVLRRGHPRHPR